MGRSQSDIFVNVSRTHSYLDVSQSQPMSLLSLSDGYKMLKEKKIKLMSMLFKIQRLSNNKVVTQVFGIYKSGMYNLDRFEFQFGRLLYCEENPVSQIIGLFVLVDDQLEVKFHRQLPNFNNLTDMQHAITFEKFDLSKSKLISRTYKQSVLLQTIGQAQIASICHFKSITITCNLHCEHYFQFNGNYFTIFCQTQF